MTFWSHVKRAVRIQFVALDVQRLTAPNPSPMTLEGTNTYVVGREPATVIDPGPEDAGHIQAIREVADGRGGIGTVLLTHDDADHLAGVDLLGVDPARPADGETVAGLTVVATPGHAAEHLCFLLPDVEGGSACFCGDLILGQGSTIVGPREFGGSLSDYMESLRRLQRLELTVLYPGHGPEVHDPQAKIAEYSPTARSGKIGSSRRSIAGSAAGRRCSPRSGTTCPSSCARLRPSRCRPTSRSSRTRAGCPAI